MSGEESEINVLQVKTLYCKIKQKKILDGISCKFSSGMLHGILGPSGSGKSTLLNILSGYKHNGAEACKITMNNSDCTFKYLRNISCYVTQEIHLNDLLTVEENMKSAADFKLGNGLKESLKYKMIFDILSCFGLESSTKTRTGHLSGGEKKRLSIALEMISDPQIIFLDEPTTGLDIVATSQIIFYLKALAERGKMVICSIHQVAARQFEMFDMVQVLGDGKSAYLGTPQNLIQFLDQRGFPCNIYHNPADYVIELCCGDYGNDKLDVLVEASSNGLICFGNYYQDEQKIISNKKLFETCEITKKPTWWFIFYSLMRREYIKLTRNIVLLHLRMISTLMVSFAISILFNGFGDDASKIFFCYNLVLTIAALLLLCGLLFPIITFPLEMDVLKREIYNKYYTIGQYYLTITLLDLPFSMFCFSSTTFLIYYMSGQLLETYRVSLFLLTVNLMGFLVHGIGLFFGTALKLNSAIFFGTVSQLPIMSLSGFALFFRDIPWYLQHTSILMYPRHCVNAIMITFWGLDRKPLECSAEVDYCYYKDAKIFMDEVGVHDEDYWINVMTLIIWLVCIKSVTYFSMKHRVSV